MKQIADEWHTNGFVAKADGPAFHTIAQHMFQMYDDDHGHVYCVSCDRVMVSARVQIESHYRSCDRSKTVAADEASPPDHHSSTAAVCSRKKTYTCGPCVVAMDDPEAWTHHFGTADHWHLYVAAIGSASYEPLFVYECRECDVTLYDTEDAIELHVTREHRSRYRIAAGDRFTAAVYAALALSRRCSDSTGADAVHCCVGCETVDTRPVHAELRPECTAGGGGHAETFYCASCRVTMVCDAHAYRRHRRSPEHAAMAEYDERPSCGDKADDDRSVPLIVRRLVRGERQLHRSSDVDGSPWRCLLCSCLWPRSVKSHLARCRTLRAATDPCAFLAAPPCGKSPADYNAFRCGVCRTSAGNAVAWSRHLHSSAAAHAETPHRMDARAYYECTACRTLYYGPRDWSHDTEDGSRCVGAKSAEHRFRPFGPVANLMRFVYRDINSAGAADDYDDCEYEYDGYGNGGPHHYYYEQRTGRYGRCDRSARPASVPFYCPTCRLEFYGDRALFRKHALTAEHVLIRLFASIRRTATAKRGNYAGREIQPIFEHTGVEDHVTGGRHRWPRYAVKETTGLDAVLAIYDGGDRFDATPSPPTTIFEQLNNLKFDPSSM